MKILIVGGGIAGTALACFLQNQNQCDVTLIEKAPMWKNIGFNVGLWASGTRILEKLGLGEKLRELSREVQGNKIFNFDGSLISEVGFDSVEKYGLNAVIHRSCLQKLLTENLKGNVKIRFGITLQSWEENETGVKARFSSGEESFFHLIVAADGMRSHMRSLIFPENILKNYGWHAWIFELPKEKLVISPELVEIWSHPGISYFYPGNESTTVGIVKRSVTNDSYAIHLTRDELKEQAAEMGPHILKIISLLPQNPVVYQDDLTYVSLRNWYKGKIIFIGDSKHGVSPISGLGATLALEDAFVLAEEIATIKRESQIDNAVKRFGTRRERRVRNAQQFIFHAERALMKPQLPLFAYFRNCFLKAFPTYILRKVIPFLKGNP